MKFAILSDIHSNVEALTSVLLALYNNNEKIDKLLITGDIVGYGPSPNECCLLIRYLKSGRQYLKDEIEEVIQNTGIAESDKKNVIKYIFSMGKSATVIVGNHDKEVLGQPSYVGTMALAAGKAASWTADTLKKENFRFLNSLWYKKKLRKFGIQLVHSTPVYPMGWEYSKNAGVLHYDLLGAKITFAGHTHSPAAYRYTSEKSDIAASVYIPADQYDIRLMQIERSSSDRMETFDVDLSPIYRYYINPGSVGQPRDGNALASYMIYDTDIKKVSLKKAEYNTEETVKNIIEAKLPRELATRIQKGV